MGGGVETGLLFAAYCPSSPETYSIDQVGSNSDPPPLLPKY